MGSTDEPTDTDEIATLCVNKLRGMVVVNGDPNRKYDFFFLPTKKKKEKENICWPAFVYNTSPTNATYSLSSP